MAKLELPSRKKVAQAGVVLFVVSMFFPLTGLPGLLLLLLASLIPEREGEEFGSLWPLVGYDNAHRRNIRQGPMDHSSPGNGRIGCAE